MLQQFIFLRAKEVTVLNQIPIKNYLFDFFHFRFHIHRIKFLKMCQAIIAAILLDHRYFYVLMNKFLILFELNLNTIPIICIYFHLLESDSGYFLPIQHFTINNQISIIYPHFLLCLFQTYFVLKSTIFQ
jgi:hypothetical protein